MGNKNSSKESRYEKEYNEHRVADAILTLATGGLSQLLPSSVDCKITDKETGKTADGAGTSKTKAEDSAWSNLWSNKK